MPDHSSKVSLLPQSGFPSTETVEELLQRGTNARDSGNLREALLSFEGALRRDPTRIGAWVSLAELLWHMGEQTAALDSLRQALLFDADDPDARVLLGNIHRERQDLESASECYRVALRRAPEHLSASVNLASLLRSQRKHEEALQLLEGAHERWPEHPHVSFNLANTLADCGQFDEARTHYKASLNRHPRPAQVLFNYGTVHQFREEDRAELAEWKRWLESRELSVEDRVHREFFLGKAHDDLNEPEAAFGHFARGNSLVQTSFSPQQQRDGIDRSIQIWTAEWFERHKGIGDERHRPIFIVGMPRSGTSLVERILSGHEEVVAGGEREDLGRIIGELSAHVGCAGDHVSAAGAVSPEDLAGAASEYARRALPEDSRLRGTDKMPAHVFLLGWIAAMFPGARVLHCRRDPRDVCLSCYFQHFTRRIEYAYDLTHLVECYRNYERLTEHWREVLPIPVLEVSYESLVTDPEPVIREMLSFCDLDWTPACLETARPRGVVSTASHWQARQPIYRSSQQRWRRYRDHITQLLDAFGEDDIART